MRNALDAGSDRVVVWGGDGTLNEVAGSLLDTGMRLGVVPGGSGNGLARGLGLPLDVQAARARGHAGSAARHRHRVRQRPLRS